MRLSSVLSQFRCDDRGQSLIDFVLGVSLLFLVITFAFGTVPTLTAPFDTEAPSGVSMTTADRHADTLALDVLPGVDGARYTLNSACTKAVVTETASQACETDSDSLHSIVGANDFTSVNLTVSQMNGQTASIDGVKLTTGSSPQTTEENIYTAIRIVSIEGEQHRLVYRIW